MSIFRGITASAAASVVLLAGVVHAAPTYTTVLTDVAGDANGIDQFGATDDTVTVADVPAADIVALDLRSDGHSLTMRLRLSGAPSAQFDYGIAAVDSAGCDFFVQLNGTARSRLPFVNRVCKGKHSPRELALRPVLGPSDITLRIPYALLPRGLGRGSTLRAWYADCAHGVLYGNTSYETVNFDNGEGEASYRLR